VKEVEEVEEIEEVEEQNLRTHVSPCDLRNLLYLLAVLHFSF
jgi:hypothetical protein